MISAQPWFEKLVSLNGNYKYTFIFPTVYGNQIISKITNTYSIVVTFVTIISSYEPFKKLISYFSGKLEKDKIKVIIGLHV